MGDSSGSMFYGVIGFLVVYFVGYFICRVYAKINTPEPFIEKSEKRGR